MERYKLEKPTLEKPFPKKIMQMDLKAMERDLLPFIEGVNTPEYLYWDKVKYKPRPKDMNAEEFWALLKFTRQYSLNRTQTTIRDEKGNYFSWLTLPGLDYFQHEVDMQLGGLVESYSHDILLNKQKYITRGIMEEAIASSQLEGANTTRKAAKKMLLEKRDPANRSEQMILNNFLAMQEIEQKLVNYDLSKTFLLDLHTTITDKTIEDGDIGRFRKDEDEIVVGDTSSDIIYHVPPAEKFMMSEIDRFIDYANDTSSMRQFVHPLIKAIILHFWIGYLHPFTDGNGRVARSIFYWYMLKNKYWAFVYLPISRIIKSSPAQYRDAYIYTEQDDNDLTYFIDYNIRKIKQAKIEFEKYLKRKEKENQQMAEIARSKYSLNDRQIQLLRYLYKNPNSTTTIKLHSTIHSVTRITARKDLEGLEKSGFLFSKKSGRERLFEGSTKIQSLFK